MSGQTTQIGAAYPSYMNPMQNTGYMYQMGAMMDDIYARQLYTSLNNNYQTTSGYSGAKNTATTQTFSGAQAQNRSGLGGPLLGGLAVGGAAYAGMNYANHRFNSPIEEVDGVTKFNENFVNHFAGEYAAVENGEKISKFYQELGGEKIKAENIENVFADLKTVTTENGFREIEAIAEKNPNLKEVLAKEGILNAEGKCVKNIDYVRNFYTGKRLEFNNLNTEYNILSQKSRLERAGKLEEVWNACKGSPKAKHEFLLLNSDVLGIEADDVKNLVYNDKIEQDALDGIYKKYGSDINGLKNKYTNNVNNLKNSMDNLAQNCINKDAGFFAKKGELFKGAGEEMSKGLTNALTKARRSRSLWVAGIAALATAIIWGSSRKKA